MEDLEIDFQYCYGIKNLKYKFTFRNNKVFGIYAPNGMMKSSFAKTFKDIADNRDSRDLAFPERKTKRIVKVDENDILPEVVFVIEHYNDSYQSDKMTTLLVNKNLKKEYDVIHKSVDKIKKEFLKKLKNLSGLSQKDIEKEVSTIFNKDFLDVLLDLKDFVNENETNGLEKVKYKKIFIPEVLKFIKENQKEIEEYTKKYDELIEKSLYLKRDFNFYNIENVTKQLGNNHFFKAGHSVNLSDGKKKIEFNSDEALRELIEEEKKKVLSDTKLKSKFDLIDKKLSNAKLREFRDCLLEHQEILVRLTELNNFAKDLWKFYFIKEKELFNQLVEKYSNAKVKIDEIIKKAKEEQTEWENAIEIFNNRFIHLPFSLSIRNKDDVILKGEIPAIDFIFKDGEDEKIYNDKSELLTILSTGEQRALYILNIIFEIEARKKLGQDNLLIIDDIADSFDYKNKYAIIDYLKYISELDNFYMIILTHNFDFFRAIHSRGITFNRKQCLFAVRSSESIELKQAQYLKNPFNKVFKNNLDDPKKLIASIPFVRNIIEYTKSEEDEEYLKLTSLLHIKENSYNIKIDSLIGIFSNAIPTLNFSGNNLDKKVLDLIFETAEECLNEAESINLENKIVLSIATRLKAESFMIEKINDDEFVKSINSNQTRRLLQKFEEIYNNEKKVLDVLKKVNLITPENIHINSFMYEPIIDMGDGELKKLYKDTKKLNDYMIGEK